MQITWFGHSAFRVEIPDAKILIDPFFTGNPTFPGTVDAASAGVTHIVLTHGHGDHVGDTVAIAKKTGATVVANPEIVGWLAAQGVEKLDMGNTGGTVSLGAFTVTFTQALHSSSISGPDGGTVYMGNPLGIVIKAHGQPTLYHMGDTDLFSDMKLIDELHRPDIGIVPIGDRFTMSAKSAAYACSRFFNFKKVIPCHYGTFPLLAQSADEFVEDMSGSRAIVYVPERGVAFEALDPAL